MALDSFSFILLLVSFFAVAFFYSSVGLAGGSSYTALLAIFGAGTQIIPMISLLLNIFVSTIGSVVFFRQGHARIKLIVPFLISSIPFAYLGGALHVSVTLFHWLLLISLVIAAFKVYFPGKPRQLQMGPQAKIFMALIFGAMLGLVSGIVGIGGGIYLVPLIILLGLGSPKEAAACGAVFIWVNSVAGFMSRLQFNSIDLVPFIPLLAVAVLGGVLGSTLGAGRFSPQVMQKILGSILVVAILFLIRDMYFI